MYSFVNRHFSLDFPTTLSQPLGQIRKVNHMEEEHYDKTKDFSITLLISTLAKVYILVWRYLAHKPRSLKTARHQEFLDNFIGCKALLNGQLKVPKFCIQLINHVSVVEKVHGQCCVLFWGHKWLSPRKIQATSLCISCTCDNDKLL